MSFPTVLFRLDDDKRASARLDEAISFARRHSSHLIGLSCHRPAPNLAYASAGLHRLDPLTIELEAFERLARERESVFLRRCDAAHIGSFECFVDNEEASRALERRARTCDLVLMGQPDPDEALCAERREVLNHVLIHGAAPVLVLPYAGRRGPVFERVLIAWDDSREAARAAACALPFVIRAQEVHVVKFERPSDQDGSIARAEMTPVAHWLERHGVRARTNVLYSDIDAGNAILSHAADLSADLLCMGAWGRSRLAESVLGGATRTVLQSMTLPMLASH